MVPDPARLASMKANHEAGPDAATSLVAAPEAVAVVEKFVPTPVARWKQENGVSGGGAAGEDAGDVGSEHAASYGVYLPLRPMSNAAPYPMASKVRMDPRQKSCAA